MRTYPQETPDTLELFLVREENRCDAAPSRAQDPPESRAIDPQALSALAKTLGHLLDNPQVRLALAGDARTPPALLGWLAQDARDAVQLALLRNPSTPTNALFMLACHDTVCRALAFNPSAPPVLLAALANDWDSAVRQAVVRNPNTPAKLLGKLARDRDLWVRHGVASNPHTPEMALRELAEENDPLLCRALAGNACTPPEVLDSLAERDDPVIQARLALHQSRQQARPESSAGTVARQGRPTTLQPHHLPDKALSYA